MKLLITLTFVVSSFFSLAQTQNLASGSSCTCLPGYTVCQADAMFMSCCTCCQPGSSCGAWSAFGLCGCKCESTASLVNYSEVKFYPIQYEKFMDYLEQNNIGTAKFRGYAQTAVAGKSTITGAVVGYDYVTLPGTDAKNFSEPYIAEMKELMKNPKISAILDTYLNKKN